MKTVYWLVAVCCCAFVLATGSTPAMATIVDPTDLDNLQLWLDASDPDGDDTVGGSLDPGATGTATWVDKSGGGRDALQTTVASQPTLTTGAGGINNIPVVHFDGVDDYLANTIDSLNSYQAKTVFVVYRVTNAQTSELGQLWGQYNGVGHVAADGRNTGLWSFDGNASATAHYSVNGDTLIAGGGGDSTQPWVRNEAQFVTTVFDSTLSLTEHYLGSLLPTFSITSHAYGGDIAEIVVYSDSLSATEIADVQTYLGDKWGIVPEPSTLLLAAIGLLGLVGFAWRRRRD